MKKCPQCGKNPGFHYIYTTSKGVFCSKECADKYEERKFTEQKTQGNSKHKAYKQKRKLKDNK